MNTMPICPDCQHTAHETWGCVDSDTCMCERMWTHDEHDQITNACECEHSAHFPESNVSHGSHTHNYLGVASVARVKTIYGTFRMCASCADAMPTFYLDKPTLTDESRTLTCDNPRCEHFGASFTSTGFTAMCSSCGNVLVRLT